MAKLQRFIKLNDRFDSQVFTFMLPPKLVTDNNPETYTKDVTYGYHKWTAIFTRTNVHLGCYLKLLSGCEGMKCQIDFSYTLLNREHFTRNEAFIEKGCVFTQDSTQHGRKNFVALGEMVERDFAQASGEFLIELEMRKINCSFECYVRLPRETPNARYATETKLESSYFSYGLCDWSISITPNEGSVQQDEHVTLQLHRHTSFDHICNVRYYITLGENGAFQSEELDQLVDTTGNGETYVINGSVHQLARGRSSLRMKVTMVSVVTVSEVTLNVASRSNSRAHLYDRDKQAWLMEADTTGKYLTLCLYYTDVTHVPRKYSRYVCWNILVLTRYIPEHKVKTNYGPFSRYYVQQDLDEGYHIYTTIPVDELHDERCLYTEPDDARITVHIEWVESHLLAQPSYNAQDDIDKLQKHQMRREIIALQSENLALEKQLLVYQQSLSKAIEKDKDKKRDKTAPNNVVEKVRDHRLTDRVTPINTPSHTPTERKTSRDESGYYSDKTGGFNNGKTGTGHSEKNVSYYDETTANTKSRKDTGTSHSDKTGSYYNDIPKTRKESGTSHSEKVSSYYDDTSIPKSRKESSATHGDKVGSYYDETSTPKSRKESSTTHGDKVGSYYDETSTPKSRKESSTTHGDKVGSYYDDTPTPKSRKESSTTHGDKVGSYYDDVPTPKSRKESSTTHSQQVGSYYDDTPTAKTRKESAHSDKVGSHYEDSPKSRKESGTIHSDKMSSYYEDTSTHKTRKESGSTHSDKVSGYYEDSPKSRKESGSAHSEKVSSYYEDSPKSRKESGTAHKENVGSYYDDTYTSKSRKESTHSDKTGSYYEDTPKSRKETGTTHSDKSSYYDDVPKSRRGENAYIDDTVGTGSGYGERTATPVDAYGDKVYSGGGYFDKTTTGGSEKWDKMGSGSSYYTDIYRTTGVSPYSDSGYLDKHAAGNYGDKVSKSSSYVDKSGSYGDTSSYYDKNTVAGTNGDKVTGGSSSYGDKPSRGTGSPYSDKTSRNGSSGYIDKTINYMDKAGGYYEDKITGSVGYVKSSSSGYCSDRTDGNGRSGDKSRRSSGYDDKVDKVSSRGGAYVEKSSSSGYHSDRSERSYYKEKVPTEYCDRPRSDRHRNERRRSSHRDGREKSHDRSSTSSNDRLSYRYR